MRSIHHDFMFHVQITTLMAYLTASLINGAVMRLNLLKYRLWLMNPTRSCKSSRQTQITCDNKRRGKLCISARLHAGIFVALYAAERRFIRKARPLGVPRQLHRLPALEKSRRGRLRTGMERTRMFSERT